MNKLSTKKMLTVLITLAMVFSALAVLSIVAQPAYAASGSITLDPTVFAINTATITLANGGTFGAGATVTFYMSPTTTFTSSSTPIGTFTLPAGTTTLSNAVVTLKIPSGTAAGSYYVAASDTGTTFTSPVPITVSSLVPTITVSPSSAAAGSTVTLTGSGFDSGSTITVYLNYASGPVLLSSVSAAALSVGVPVTVPTNEPTATYNIVAQESSSSSPNYGITADTSLTITPAVIVSPSSISGAVTSTFTLTGYDFPADDSFAASTSLKPTDTITVAGVDALNPAFTSSSTGSFTVTVTGLTSAITVYGQAYISVTDETPITFSDVGTVIVSSPNPSALGFTFSITPTYGTTYNVNDSVAITVYNFLASQNVQFFLGATLVGSLTTDSNGAGTLSTVVPPLPAGTYTPTAVVPSQHLVAVGTSYTISASFEAVDPTGALLNVASPTYGEYIPSNGMITVRAFGLNPSLNTYDFYDSIVAPPPTGVYASGLVVSISVGTGTSDLMQPAPNGTLIFTYSPDYAAIAPSTGTPGVITSAVSGVLPYGSATASYQYYAIGPVVFTSPSPLEIYAASSTGNSLSITGLIPVTAALYPGVTNEYNAYIGTSELTLTFTNPSGVTVTGTVFNAGDKSITFATPSTPGIYNFSITFNGQSVSSAVGVQTIVVSSSGSSPSSGTLVLLPTSTGWDVVGFGYEQSLGTVDFYYMTDTGRSSPVSETLTDGAFVDTSTLATAPSEPAGTYSVFTEVTVSGANYFVYSSYTVTASLTITSPSPASGPIGTSITASATGLEANAYYDVYFAGMYMEALETSSAGTISITITVPLVPPGTYNITITPVGSTTVVASAPFAVTAPTTLTLSLVQGDETSTAFPGELVNFVWKPSSPPNTPTSPYGPITVTVYLNGSTYTSIPAAFNPSAKTLSGSFLAPNAAAGSYWGVSLGWSQIDYTTSTLSGSTLSATPISYTGHTEAYLGLVSGGGALVVGINSSSIATIITSAISSAMKVPLSELNASVVSINNAVATIKTAFGNMTATLKAINASVAGIVSGQAIVVTELGTVETSLASLNASVLAVNAGIVTLQTSVGSVQTSLNNLAPVISDINGTVMMINTTVGNINMNLTEFSNMIVKAISNGTATVTGSINGMNVTMQSSLSAINAKLVALNGSVATINTALGTVQTSLSSINMTVSSTASSVSGLVGSVATITSDLGTISGTVTSVSNGVATIQTSLGNLNVSVSQVKTSANQIKTSNYTLEIFLIVVLVLILITLVIAFLAVSNTNKLAKKFEEQKKQ